MKLKTEYQTFGFTLEQDAEYCKIAEARIDNYTEESKKVKTSINTNQPTLF